MVANLFSFVGVARRAYLGCQCYEGPPGEELEEAPREQKESLHVQQLRNQRYAVTRLMWPLKPSARAGWLMYSYTDRARLQYLFFMYGLDVGNYN